MTSISARAAEFNDVIHDASPTTLAIENDSKLARDAH
jgi:hypothetical protein